jgi:Flp pilus assembly protein TadB
MPDRNEEQERLQRLRNRQLADRNPHVKRDEFYRSSNERERRAARPYSLANAWAEIPHIWKTPFYGLILGFLVLLAITSLWISVWAWVIGLVVIVIFIVVGVVIGQGLDTRDRIRDLSQ